MSGLPLAAYDDGIVRAYCGEVRELLADMEPESVDCVVTSPPYWGLRDYGTLGQLGLEPTPEAYVTAMVAVFAGVRRVLRPWGTLWLNMGDCYATSPNGAKAEGRQDGDDRTFRDKPFSSIVPGLKPKDLVGMPWMLAFALRADGWYLRADIVWAKPNPMPESVTDRPTKAHEYLFLLARSPRYYYDAEAIRESAAYAGPNGPQHSPYGQGFTRRSDKQAETGVAALKMRGGDTYSGFNERGREEREAREALPLTRNKRSVWSIPTQPYPHAHFATFPEELVRPCVLAGSSEHGICASCGRPWVRVVEAGSGDGFAGPAKLTGRPDGAERRQLRGGAADWATYQPPTPTGWEPSCHCGTGVVPATVLDPFAGSGTTLAVAKALNRDAIGLELNPGYLELLARRVRGQGAQMLLVL